MSTKPCSFCGKPVEQTDGRKEKKFCSGECRQKKWQQDQKVLRAHIKHFGMSQFTPVIPSQVVAPQSPEVPQNTVADYEAEIKATTYSGDYEKIMKAIDKDSLIGAAAKAKLRAIGDNHRINFTN